MRNRFSRMNSVRVHKSIVQSSEHVHNLPRLSRIALTAVLDRNFVAFRMSVMSVMMMMMLLLMQILIMMSVIWIHLAQR